MGLSLTLSLHLYERCTLDVLPTLIRNPGCLESFLASTMNELFRAATRPDTLDERVREKEGRPSLGLRERCCMGEGAFEAEASDGQSTISRLGLDIEGTCSPVLQ